MFEVHFYFINIYYLGLGGPNTPALTYYVPIQVYMSAFATYWYYTTQIAKIFAGLNFRDFYQLAKFANISTSRTFPLIQYL